jgi:hypothetical protein
MILLAGVVPAYSQWQGFQHHQTVEFVPKVYVIHTAPDLMDGAVNVYMLSNDTPDRIWAFRAGREGYLTANGAIIKQNNYGLLESGDLNGDGITDLVVSGYWNNGFKIYWGESNGSFQEGDHYPVTGHGRSVKVADINNDGAQDVIAISTGSGQPITLHVFTGNNSKSITPAGVYGSLLHTDRQITIVDKNQDGLPDVMVSSSFPWFVIFYQQVDGTFIPRYWPYHVEPPFVNNFHLADLNNDSKPDIIAIHSDENTIRFYEGLSDTLFSDHYHEHGPIPFNPFRVYPVDLNRDGFTDLVLDDFLNNMDGAYEVYYMLGNGDFTFEEPVAITFPAPPWYVTVGDINADRFPDIIAYCTDLGIVTFLNSGVPTAVEDDLQQNLHVFPSPVNDQLNITFPGHFTGTCYDATSNAVYSFSSTGHTQFSVSAWPAGIYVVRILAGNAVYVRKVIKY